MAQSETGSLPPDIGETELRVTDNWQLYRWKEKEISGLKIRNAYRNYKGKQNASEMYLEDEDARALAEAILKALAD